MAIRGTLEERFFRYVSPEPNTGCWLWSGAHFFKGYGAFYDGKGARRAHQVSLELHGNPRPEGALALHKCDMPSCVNPDHLYWGTPSQNSRDMMKRGRGRGQLKRKTSCHRGHLFSDENTYVTKTGGRHCRTCTRLRAKSPVV